ncbi:helix-turn-helix domain-containing protein [Cohnella caldifontis]|uniref:helix-turn-helix domain-containing protein n=1 Tax=Cohnella caldifontis TaxID=3027471 RepID=UPI0023ED92E7|nr:helix-turn-helix domain-containing protein [Cohnella sp. YIM B05605]
MRMSERQHTEDIVLARLRSRWKASASFAFPTLAVWEPSGLADDRGRKYWAAEIAAELRKNARESCEALLDEEGRRVVLLFSWPAKDALETMRCRLSRQFDLPVSAGAGLPASRPDELPRSYRQALQALDGKFYRGVGRLICYHELGGSQRLGEYPVALEKGLFERIRQAPDAASVRAAVDDYYDRLLEEGTLDRPMIDELTIRLLIGLEKRMDAEAGGENVHRLNRGRGLMSIVKLETLAEVKAYVCEQLQGLRILETAPVGGSGQRAIIRQSIAFMERNYETATLHSTAEQVFMTPAYLSGLFKNCTGKTFIEQLTDIRIEKAKAMLKDTLLKNYEVAEKVGYKDYRYFSQVFRKKVGVSPSEYRESASMT